MTKILAFSGSARKGSFNQAVVTAAAKAAEDAGAEVTIVNLGDFPMPLFNEDLEAEQGMPAAAKAFKQLLIDHDGFLIASPEYNSSYPALFKNSIDWASRMTEEGEQPLTAYKGKVVGLLASSPGGLGGMRVLVPLRMLMQNLGCIVAPSQAALSFIGKAIDEQGQVVDEKTLKQIAGVATQTVDLASKLK